LNAVARNYQSEFPAWRAGFESEFDYKKVSAQIESTGRKLEGAKQFLRPPLVTYEKPRDDREPAGRTSVATGSSNSAPAAVVAVSSNAASAAGVVAGQKSTTAGKSKARPASAIFAYLLPGMAAMFLLFLASHAVTDLLRELQFRTFERYQTMQQHVLPFVAGKLIFGVVLVLVCAAILLGGGGLAFRIQWEHPWALALLTFTYACFATALMAFLVALMPDERRAGVLTNIVGMMLAMAGGCMFPREQLPRFMADQITPLLPSAWFVDAARHLQFEGTGPGAWVLLKFGLATALFLAAAVAVFARRVRARE
jgi:ABC-type multidrug transport system permease subunit